mmetsp:Transcript_110224/g.351305  ORF Transcript_110224/g.351305 Transcript_110224/m.351305 type:complete len:577 (+) Transcript_110224:1936-3666(+)
MTLRCQKLCPFWLCMVIVWNLPYGPHKEHQRFHQLAEATKDLYDRFKPSEVLLFLAKAKGIIDCYSRNGHEFHGESSEEEQVWQLMKTRLFAPSGGSRVSLSRFCGSIHAAGLQVPWWEVQEFERMYVALECDMLSSKATAQKFTVKPAVDGENGEGGASTNPQRFTLEDKQNMMGAESAVVHSCLMLEKSVNFRVCMSVVVVTKHLISFYTEAAKRCKCADGNQSWVKDMVSAGIVTHLRDILRMPESREAFEKTGFLLGSSEMKVSPPEEVITEDELQDMLGQFCYRLAACRSRRLLYLSSGWPGKMFQALVSAGSGQTVLARFKHDSQTFDEFKDLPEMSKAMRKVVDRSVFQKTSTKQALAGCEQYGWTLGPDLHELLRKRTRLMVSTIAVEETIGVQKNTRMSAAQRRFKKPETSYFVALKGNLLGSRHKYKTISADIPLASKLRTFSDDAFRAKAANRSMNLAEVVGTSQTPSWYSPSATNMNVPIADLFMLRECKQLGDFELVNTAWLGEMVDVAHKVLFRSDQLHNPGVWMFRLLHFSWSGCLAWPGRLVRVAAGRDVFVWEADLHTE